MKQLFLIVLIMTSFSLRPPNRLAAQTAVPVTISIRHADGTPAVAAEITLTSQPDYRVHTAVTGREGQAQFEVSRGIYEVTLPQPLDRISTLAVAESGFGGFGITVGDDPITYHFTLQDDGYVYFDRAPEAAVPDPVIPELKDLHFIGGAGQTTATTLAEGTVTPAATMTGVTPGETAVVPTETAVSPAGIKAAATTLFSQEAVVDTKGAPGPGSTLGADSNPDSQGGNWILLLAIMAGILVGVVAAMLFGRKKS